MSGWQIERLLDALEKLIRDGNPNMLINALLILSGQDHDVIKRFCSGIPGCEDAWKSLSDEKKESVIRAVERVLLEKSMVPLKEDPTDANIYLDICPILLRYAYFPIESSCFKNPEEIDVRSELLSARNALESIIREGLPREVSGLKDCLEAVKQILLISQPRRLPPINICLSCQKNGNCRKGPVLLNPCFFASPHFGSRLPNLYTEQKDDQLLLKFGEFVVARLKVGSSGR